MKKEKPVCSYCGSENVTCDAAARWDMDAQAWVLADTHDGNNDCGDCNGETKLVWKEVEDGNPG